MKLLDKVIKISSLAPVVVLVLFITGCASESFVTDEGSAAAQHADQQNYEFQQKGVPRRTEGSNR
jgi:PBP1b-binding outer membrane lipoprotein LpoB